MTVRALHVVILALETPRGVVRLLLLRIGHEEPSVHSGEPHFHSIFTVGAASPKTVRKRYIIKNRPCGRCACSFVHVRALCVLSD